MPEFRQASEITVESRGEGWTASVLGDSLHVPGMPMSARLWRIEAGATGPEQAGEEGVERFLYVVSGTGSLLLGGTAEELGREDVVWIEPQDRFRLRAGSGAPLTVLDSSST